MSTVARILILFSFLVLAVPVCCQPGCISIDCGITEDFNYTDDTNQIFYTSDAKFIDTGINSYISCDYLSEAPRRYQTLRSFPDGTRNCYTLTPVVKTNRYLIRASFMYGDYDGLDKPPKFNVYVDVNRWDIDLPSSSDQLLYSEIVAFATRDFISVCLVNTGRGTPYISSLESRLLDNWTYPEANQTHFLQSYDTRTTRVYPGQYSGVPTRYPQVDVYDRTWNWPYICEHRIMNTPAIIDTSSPIDLRKDLGYQSPFPAMMKSAFGPSNSSFNTLSYRQPTFQGHDVYLNFTEAGRLQPNQSREVTFSVYGTNQYGTFFPKYMSVDTVQIDISNRDVHVIQLNSRTRASTPPPILNAYEIYRITFEFCRIKRSLSPTNDRDVKAMIDIKATYMVKRNWMGDPCLPKDYLWEGLTCNFSSSSLPTIVSLDLSSTGLNGEIAPSLANLMSIEYLDLSANNLVGTIPNFLGELPSLSYLNLTGNQLTGRVPSNLLERSKRGLLKLSVDNNPSLNFSYPSSIQSPASIIHRRKITSIQSTASAIHRRKITIPFIAVYASLIFLLISVSFKWRKRDRVAKAKKADGFQHFEDFVDSSKYSKNGQFPFAEVVRMTNDFQRSIGIGGFGTVYHGQERNGNQVAVKVLSPQSVKSLSHRGQGFKEFQNEVQLLMRVHHRNLVPFIGYCKEGDNMALIYEYMAQGNLESHLSGTSSQTLSWGQRLRIALDVAQGLEYLHSFCIPPVIHRDMKPANILLNEKFEAKIGDFGISKVLLKDDGQTHVSTKINGTHGYLDPEYFNSGHLTEKSDVYSFGVVVLQLITGRPAIIRNSDSEPINLVKWIAPFVRDKNLQGMIDPRLEGDYDANSIWEAVEIARSCTSFESIERPTMSEVLVILMECLETETAEGNRSIKESKKSNLRHSMHSVMHGVRIGFVSLLFAVAFAFYRVIIRRITHQTHASVEPNDNLYDPATPT